MIPRRSFALCVVAAIGLATALLYPLLDRAAPGTPDYLVRQLPKHCQQVIVVTSPQHRSTRAVMHLRERQNAGWQTIAELPCTLGRNGLAWGLGEHLITTPDGYRAKVEGDGCSPAGIFRIPLAFGTAAKESSSWLRLPYTALTPTIIGVDDPKSRHYNQIVDSSIVERDWASNEAMMRHDKLYQWGAFIAHNPGQIPGAGSCIFLHLWPGEGEPTAGCTALSAEDLRRVLAWIDPGKEPRLVQAVE
jgi:L,D-peptidoglycan transpeptidase YkuD (ErfK/YbiS/YcfS/YnhG family)